MKTLIFSLLVMNSALFGHVAVTENEPSALVEGIVNAVTGDLYVVEDDIVIQGAEPLRLRRSYISANGEGNWGFIDNLFAVLRPPIHRLTVSEPNGTRLDYLYEIQNTDKKKHKKKKPKSAQYDFHPLNIAQDAQGLTNTARGKISAHTNLKNQYVRMDEDHERFIVICPNGTKRIYVALPNQKPEKIGPLHGGLEIYMYYSYVLQSEELPNGNRIIYDWNKSKLVSIRTTDPSGQKTYTQATFHYHGKIKEKHHQSYLNNADFDVHTSDGRTLHYHHICEGKPEKGGRWQLHQITSSDFPVEFLHYHGPDKNRKSILGAITLPLGRGLHVGYYQSGNDPTCSRVQSLSAPVANDATPLVTHRFHYDLPKRQTTALDVNGAPTRYSWDENLRLTAIERYTTSNVLYAGSLFAWGTGQDEANLRCKTLFDENRKPIYATGYSYDSRGNVVLEKFYGNLSGQGIALSLDSQHLPIENGVEFYTNKFEYSQDDRHLLHRKEEGNGLVVTYDYLSGTDLPTAELTADREGIKRRKFYEYNADHILVREISDDGRTHDKNDLSNVTTRKILQIHLKQDAPYLNMPQVIEAKYWDGQEERLLKKTILHYTTGGRIERKDIYDGSGRFRYSLSYKYDAKGNLSEETNALGQTTKHNYDELGNKTFFQDFGGRAYSETNYDYSNRPIQSKEFGEDGITRTTRNKYDKRHNKTLTVDFHGYATGYAYDDFNLLKEAHLPMLEDREPVIRCSYDAAGLEITRTDAKGYTTHTTYNAYGKPTCILHPNDTQEKFIYNLDGTLRTYIDQKGVETSHTYDLFKRPTSITKSYQGEILSQELFTYDAYHLIAKADAEGNITTYAYDGAGRKISEELNEEHSEFAYDVLGRLHLVKQGELLSVTEHDLLDRIVEERKEDLHGHVLSKIVYAYDNAGNKKTVTRFINGKEAPEQFEYDSFNRLIKKEDPLGNTTRTIFDDGLHSQTIIDPLGLQTIEHFNSHYLAATIEKRSCQDELLMREENAYDTNDNLVAKTTTLFAPKRSVTTLWDYGPLDQLLSQTEAAGTSEQKVTRYSYTPTGQLLQTIKPSSVVLTNTYDPLQHLLSQSSSDGTMHYSYQHNRLGHLIQSVDESNQTTLMRTYDPKGRLLSEKLSNNLFVCNHYDTQGRRIRLDLPDRSFISYEHDPLHLRSVTRYDSSGHLVYAHHYTNYDLAGNLLSQTLIGNRDRVVHSYDLAGRPTLVTSPHFTHAILEYDAVGNVLRSDLDNEILEYTYDDLYQLASEKEHTYTHDSLYNRLQKDSASYAVNALNQLSSVFKYNEDGNPYSHGKARYTYDAFDRLISMEDHSTKLQFAYDSYHRRLSKTVYRFANDAWEHVETRFFLYDDQNEIGSVDAAGNIQELRILGRTPQAEIGSAIAIELQGKIFAPIHDLYGNVSMLLSLSDKNHEHYCYTAFGEERNPSPTINPWRFSSKRIDNETGLVYFGRRYYLPTYGRWLTPDPLGLDAGPNLYAYVFNAPLTHVDLYGLFALNNSEDFKQTGIAATHGLGHFALDTATAVSTMTWIATSPLRAVNWITGKSTPSHDWNSLQQSNRAFYNFGDRWMQRVLPGNRSHENFMPTRSGVSSGLGLGTLAIGTGAAIMKGASLMKDANAFMKSSIARQLFGMQKNSSSPIGMQVSEFRKTNIEDWAQLSGTLRQASKGKGNFGLGTATREQADVLGKAWVGDRYRISSDGTAWISPNGMRQYRPPSFKEKLGRAQANFERKFEGQTWNNWPSNGHLDILD